MSKDPTISEINQLLRRPSVTFSNGLSATDNDVTDGYASDMKNFEIDHGVAMRRHGSVCLHNPEVAAQGTLKWRAFHEVTIAGTKVLLGITQKRKLKAFLAKWPEIEFDVYRKGLNPMTYPESNEETYEVKFSRGDTFWMNNEDGQYLKIINNYGDAIRIDKRGYIQILKKHEFGAKFKPTYQMDQARLGDSDLAIYMDVLDATNRDIFRFYTAEREGSGTARIEGEVKVASVNECGVVGKLSDGLIIPESSELLVSTVPLNAVADGTVDLKYQGSYFWGSTEPGSDEVFATRTSDGSVKYGDVPLALPLLVNFNLLGLIDEANRIKLVIVPTDNTYKLDTSVFYQFPPSLLITDVWDGEDFTAGNQVWNKLKYNLEANIGVAEGDFWTDIESFTAVAGGGTMVGNDLAQQAYTLSPVNPDDEDIYPKLANRQTPWTLTDAGATSSQEISFMAKGRMTTLPGVSPYKLMNVVYKYSRAIISRGSVYGLSDRGMDIWDGKGEISVSAPSIDVRTKKAVIDVGESVDAIVATADLNDYAGSGGSRGSGLGASGRFAVWNNKFLLGQSQVGWQVKGDDFGFVYNVPDDLYDKSIDDTSDTGRVVNQLPEDYLEIRMQSCPVMSLSGTELRRRAYEEPIIYEPIRDPSHVAANDGRIFVVQGASLWIGNFSTLMLDTVVDLDFTVSHMEPFADGVAIFTNKGIKKVSTAGAIMNVNTEQIKSEAVKSAVQGGSSVFAVSEMDEVFQIVMIFEGTTVPYPKAILASAPVHTMEWGADPKMAYVDGTLWVGRESDAWGFSDGIWSKQKDFTGKTIDKMFGFDNRLCIAFYDVPNIDAEDSYSIPGRS